MTGRSWKETNRSRQLIQRSPTRRRLFSKISLASHLEHTASKGHAAFPVVANCLQNLEKCIGVRSYLSQNLGFSTRSAGHIARLEEAKSAVEI